jgi:hypothetical protein
MSVHIYEGGREAGREGRREGRRMGETDGWRRLIGTGYVAVTQAPIVGKGMHFSCTDTTHV